MHAEIEVFIEPNTEVFRYSRWMYSGSVVISDGHLVVALGVLCRVVEDARSYVGCVGSRWFLGYLYLIQIAEINQFEFLWCKPCCMSLGPLFRSVHYFL